MKKLIQLAVVATVLIPRISTAQSVGWLQDRSRAQGPGFRVGNLELHPGFGAEIGYDSNVFYEDADGPLDSTGSLIFRLTPHLLLSTLSGERLEEGEGQEDDDKQMVQFSAGVSAEAYLFLESAARSNVGLSANFDLSVNPQGRFGFRLYDDFTRRIRPFTGRVNEVKRDYGVDTNVVGTQLIARSRGGTLSASLGYAFRLQYFEDDLFAYARNFTHQFSADTHFKFFPSTSLFWDAALDFSDFYNSDATMASLALSNNFRLRTRIGLNGVITPKINATVAVGYAATFVDNPAVSDFDTVIAHAGLKVRLTPSSTLAFGYERELVASIVGLYRTQDRGYLDLQLLFGRSFLLAFNSWIARMDFGEIFDAAGTSLGSRDDIYLSIGLFGEYRFTDWLALNLTVRYLGDFTSFDYIVDSMAGPIPDPAGFNKVEAWLGLRVFY